MNPPRQRLLFRVGDRTWAHQYLQDKSAARLTQEKEPRHFPTRAALKPAKIYVVFSLAELKDFKCYVRGDRSHRKPRKICRVGRMDPGPRWKCACCEAKSALSSNPKGLAETFNCNPRNAVLDSSDPPLNYTFHQANEQNQLLPYPSFFNHRHASVPRQGTSLFRRGVVPRQDSGALRHYLFRSLSAGMVLVWLRILQRSWL